VTAKRRPRAKEKAIDEAALKASYLELYAGRDANKRLSHIRGDLGITILTLDKWNQDDGFTAKVAEIDARRLTSAQGLAVTVWPAIVEVQALLATGQLPEPPDEPDREAPDYVWQVRARLEGYKAACAAAVKMSTRAAEFIGKYLHQLQQAQGLGSYASDHEVFGRLSDHKTPEELAAELIRRENLLNDWRERLAERAKATRAQASRP